MRRAQALRSLERWHEAARSFEQAYKLSNLRSVAALADEARQKAHDWDLHGGSEGGARPMESSEQWMDMFLCLPAIQYRLALLAMCWNALPLPERRSVLRALIALLQGKAAEAETPSDVQLPESDDELADLPMQNYAGVVDSIPHCWVQWFLDLAEPGRMELLQQAWSHLTPLEQMLVERDLREFFGEGRERRQQAEEADSEGNEGRFVMGDAAALAQSEIPDSALPLDEPVAQGGGRRLGRRRRRQGHGDVALATSNPSEGKGHRQ